MDTISMMRTSTEGKGTLIDLVTPMRVWSLCVENTKHLHVWLRAICNIVKRSAVPPELKPFLDVKPEDLHITVISLSLPITFTVKETIGCIFQEFKKISGKDLDTKGNGFFLLAFNMNMLLVIFMSLSCNV